jgi:hypothetical protein
VLAGGRTFLAPWIVFRRSSMSTSFVLACAARRLRLRALHVDLSSTAAGAAAIEEGIAVVGRPGGPKAHSDLAWPVRWCSGAPVAARSVSRVRYWSMTLTDMPVSSGSSSRA